jgi:hypothetical protein
MIYREKTQKIISGWGRTKFSNVKVFETNSTIFNDFPLNQSRYSIVGSATSYGDSVLNIFGNFFSTKRMKSVELDLEHKVAKCDAGVTYEELLGITLKFGLIPEVVPGTPKATVGGSIAADIHGKATSVPNCISNSFISFELFGKNGLVEVERDSPDKLTLINSTCGGLGVTGLITSVTLPLRFSPSRYVKEKKIRVFTFENMLDQMQANFKTSEYLVGWINLLEGRNFRGLVSFASAVHFDREVRTFKKTFINCLSLERPFIQKCFQVATVRKWNLRIINFFVFKFGASERVMRLENYLFPMNKLIGWPRLHGKGGLLQWQRIFPFGSELILKEVLENIQNSKFVPSLISLKILSETSEVNLGFCLPGWNIAIDFRASQIGLVDFLRTLDKLVVAAGGRPYLIKDNYLTPVDMMNFFPCIEIDREEIRKLQPEWVTNDQLRRLGIID